MCVAWEYFEQQAIKKGFKEGFKEGFKKGFEEGFKKEIAKGVAMGLKEGCEEVLEKVVMGSLENNLDYQTIHKITGLSLAKIKKIAASAKA